jgi:hypothetical protein
VKEVCYKGSVVAYLDKQLGMQEIENEHIILEKLAPKWCSTLMDLEDRIRQSLQQVGLIYIGCHGKDGITLQQQHPGQLTAYHLVQIHKHQEPRPIALINACESSRIIRDNEWGDGSFVEILLHRCVSGYIGPMAKVGTTEASHIAARIMEAATQEKGVRIAEILRRLREEAVQKYAEVYSRPHGERKEYEYNLLYTLMYVYYGNPLACLYLPMANQKVQGVEAPGDGLHRRLPTANQQGEGV